MTSRLAGSFQKKKLKKLAMIHKPGQACSCIMTTEIESNLSADPAAVFAAALSLWNVCQKQAANKAKLNLSKHYNGMDQFMRELMRIASQFEAWSCIHIDFDETNDVWPYLLQDKFGEACLTVLAPELLAQFNESHCLRIAIELRLPIKLDDALAIPVDVRSTNPSISSGFREFQILTMRNRTEDGHPVPFTSNDDPFDEDFGHPYFVLYGSEKDGSLEHIAERSTYLGALRLAEKLLPGVKFPDSPVSCVES
jgi:hypothetical protein